MKKCKLQLPSNLTTRKCWIGSYGGHFDIVVVFNKKPRKGKEDAWDESFYSQIENKNIIAGVFDKDCFNAYFGTNIQPDETEIYSVEEYELTAWWDKFKQIVGLNAFED